MCQLLAISSTKPTPIFSSSLLHPFVQRGGNTDVHSHGWGLAYSNYCTQQKKHKLTTIRDASPAATSTKVLSLLANQSNERVLETKTLLAHIRYATVGEVCIDNVHPFHRTLFDVEFVFAHNGDVAMFKQETNLNLEDMHMNTNMNMGFSEEENPREYSRFQPVGSTDSERIFCYILNALQSRFDSFPPLQDMYHVIHEICLDIVLHEDGVILNFILGVGEHIFAYSWPGKRPGSSTWNGLYYMIKAEEGNEVNDPAMRLCDVNVAQVAVIATEPLGNEIDLWTEFNKGDLLLFSNGTMSNFVQ